MDESYTVWIMANLLYDSGLWLLACMAVDHGELEEPDAGKLHVQVCTGDAGEPAFLP